MSMKGDITGRNNCMMTPNECMAEAMPAVDEEVVAK